MATSAAETASYHRGPEPFGPDGPPGAGVRAADATVAATPVSIRVIKVDRAIVDVASAGPEQLETLVSALRELLAADAALAAPSSAARGPGGAKPAFDPDVLDAYKALAARLQGPLAPFDLSPWEPVPEGALGSVLARELLANPAVRPIVLARGASASGERPSAGRPAAGSRRGPAPSAGQGLLTRAAKQARAVDLSGRDLALASEEPVLIGGFAVDPDMAGGVILGGSDQQWARNFGWATLAESGAYTSPGLAASGPIVPPEAPAEPAESQLAPVLTRRGFRVLPLSSCAGAGACSGEDPPAVLAAILRQARAAVNFYESGAAAFVSLALVEAAVLRLPGAPAALKSLAPSYGALSGPGVVPVGARLGPSARGTWRGPRESSALAALLRQVARTEPIAASDPGTWAFDLSPLQDLYRVGAMGAYLGALTGQLDGDAVASLVTRLGLQRAQAVHAARLAHQAAKDAARARLYVLIVEDRFGSARAAKVYAALRETAASAKGAPGGSLALPQDSVRVDNPDAVLELLAPSERAVVEAEYSRRLEEWEGSVGNKCPHVRIARRLRAARDAAEALRLLGELARFFAPEASPRKRGPGAGPGADPGAGSGPPADWLMCRSCGFRALCPHVRARVEMEARRAPHEAVRTRLLEFAVKASGAGTELFMYYCRLCGEQLAEIRDEGDPGTELGRFGELDAGLRSRVWSLAATAARAVRFPVPTDERVFASGVTAVVFPLLLASEEAAGRKARVRRATAARPPLDDDPDDPEIDPLRLVDAILFVYAFVLELVRVTQNSASQEVGFAGVKLGAKLHVYGDAILRHVLATHRNLVIRAEEATNDYLRARFTEALRLIQREGAVGSGRPRGAERPEVELASQTATLDPIYRYAARVARLAGALPVGLKPGEPAEAKAEFETTLGASLPSIIKTARESAKDPALAALYLRRTGLEVPPGGTLDQLLKDPRVNLHTSLYEPPGDVPGPDAAAAFRRLGALGGGPDARSRSPAHPPARALGRSAPRPGKPETPGHSHGAGKPETPGHSHGAAAKLAGLFPGFAPRPRPLADALTGSYFTAYRLFARYTRGVPAAAAEAFRADLADYHRCAARLREALAAEALKSESAVSFAATQQFAPPAQPVTLAHLYDEEGARHAWAKGATFYYRDPRSEAAEAVRGGAGAVKKARSDGLITPGMVLVDVGCPVCGTKSSEVGTLDLAKVEAAVRRTAEIGAFFIFYEARCPLGETHDMARGPNGLRCSKCGLEAETLKAASGGRAAADPAARAYYGRFRSQFATARRLARAAERASAPAPPPATASAEASAAPEFPGYLPDYSLIVRAAELAGTTPAAVEAVGSTEGREYSKVLEGRDLPPPPTNGSDPRLFDADAEVRFLLSEYSRLRFFPRFAKPPPAISALLAEVGVPAHETARLSSLLPDVGRGYPAALAAARKSLSPSELLSFIVESLCRFALAIAGASADGLAWVAKLGRAFAELALRQVLTNQRLLAKPGTFNWTVFVEDDADFDLDQVGDVGEDVLAELLNAGGEEAPDDPFSGDHIDYDTSEDNPNNEAA